MAMRFVNIGRVAAKGLVSACCFVAAVSAALPAAAGLVIRSRPADVVSTVRSPVKVTTLANGHTLVDFGKDAAGYVQFDAKGTGAYEMIIGEALDSSGAVNNTAHAGMYNCWYSYVTDKNGKRVECSLRAVTLSGEVASTGTFRVPMTLPWQKRFDGNAHVKTTAGDEVCPFRYIEVVSLPSGVSAEDLRQVMYHYPFDYNDSSFTSSNENLDKVYDLCKWSLYADSYLGYWLDGDRERQFYQADAYVSILDSLGVFSDMTMNQRTAKEFFLDEWKHEWSVEWYLYTFLTAFQDYWHSGDISTLQTYYDKIKPTSTNGKYYKIPSQYQLENGLLASPKDGWESSIIDWPQMYRYDYDMATKGTNGSDNDDGRLMPIENALLCQQYRDLATTATALGKTADAAQWSAMATKIYNAYQEVFFDASCGLYRDKASTNGYRSAKHSIQANAAALAFGMVPADKIATVANFVANEGMMCGTYMAHLVLEGLGRAGRTDAAIAYMASTAENSWMNMINEGLTTCCETWSIASGNGVVGGTPDVNHPWSCAPASIISRYVLGVRPAAAGWTKATVAPQFGSLTRVSGKVPTAKGGVEVEYANSQLTVTVPTGMAADITFAGQTKTVAANAATRTVTITEGGTTHTHSYGAYVETTAPTCTGKGVETATCSCGAEVTREIDALGHDWTGSWTVYREPTETTAGEKRLVCKRTGCNEYQSQVIPATGGGGSGGGSGEVCTSASWTRTAVKTADFVKSADNLFSDSRVKIAISNNKDGDRYMASSDIAASGAYLQIPITQIFGTGYSVTFAGAAGLVDGLVGTTASSKDYSRYFLNRDPYPNGEGLYPCTVQSWSACLFSDDAVCRFDLPEAARLTGLKVYGYWKDNGRNRPSVAAVEVRQLGSDAWVALPGAAITVTQATTSMNCITLGAAEGFLATDVTAVRFTFGTHNNADCHGYAEIEATGEYTGVTSGGQVANAWTVEPSVTASFEEGTTPSLSLGTPVQGTPTANYTAAELAKLTPGDYTLEVRVAASDAATALRKTIGFTVVNKEVSPEAATGMYLWTERTGKFDDATKWSGVYNGTKPHLATDSVKIVNTKNQYVTIDLEGKTLTAGKLLYNAAQRGSTIMNGTLNVENVEQTCKANLIFRDLTLVGTGTGTIKSLMNFTCPTFVGNCNLQGIAVRCEKGSAGAVVRDGTLTFDRDFSYSKNGGFTDYLTVDNARLIGTAIAPQSEKHKITFTLGENNADGQPMIKLSGAFNIVAGSTLTVNAHALPAGTYTLVEATSVTDSGNVTDAATISCDKGMTATLARTATAITLTLSGEREQQIAWSDWSGKKVAFLGDSYTTYADVAGVENPEFPKTESDVDDPSKTWWQQVLTATGATLTKNLSMGGSPMTTCYTGKKSFYDRVSDSKNILSSPDAIFVFGGMNDFWMSGNFHDDPGRFGDGLRTLFDYLDANYAAAAKYVVVNKLHADTSWEKWGLTAEMREELTSNALRHGYEVIDLDGYFALEQADVDTARYPHPTAKGMTQIADRVLQVLRGEGGDEPTPTVKTATLPTAKTGLKYNGQTQTGVATGMGYTISGNTGKDAKGYTASVTLADGYTWADGSEETTRTVAWSIAKGENSWTTNPSVSPATWIEGEAPATITFANGANTFGAAVTCDTDEATLKAMTAGTKTVTFTAAANGDNYDAITHQVTVTVTAKVEPGPTPVTGEDWGYSNRVTVSGTDYMVVVFTNTSKALSWTLPANVTEIDYLVVGGGGAGGTSGNAYGAGGGGAGGVVEDSCAVASGAALAVTVGAGGEPGEASTNGGNGKGSSLSVGGTLVASALPGAGGAKGASAGPGGATDYACGGGAGGGYTSQGTKAGGAGAVSNGGSAYGQVGAGGGGAGGDGQNSGMEDGGVGCGGVGVSTTIFDGLEQRIAGGGAGSPSGRTLNTSVDGGGAGGQVDAHGNHPATAGSTWGAGGGGAKSSAVGGAGHQGVVVIRYAVGGETPTHVHVLGPWTLKTEPTCTEDGVSNRVCTASGCTSPVYEETAVAPKLGHVWGEWEVVTEATATTPGEKRHYCTHEGCDAFEAEEIPATGGDDPEPPTPVTGEDWGYSNKVTVAGTDYMVVVFTNTAKEIKWPLPADVTKLDYLVVGGGASGGSSNNGYSGGGGGAGGVAEDSLTVVGGVEVTAIVGAGGAAVLGSAGEDGTGSSLAIGETVVASALPGAGGGGGASNGRGGSAYACGGGAGGGYASQGTKNGGEGTVSKGGDAEPQKGAGGGGAGGDGALGSAGGAGGDGVTTTIFDGEACPIAGGGCGSSYGNKGKTTAFGGGATATDAVRWGAGGGGAGGNGKYSGAGHQGVVIIRYALGGAPEPQKDVVVPGEEPKAYATEAAAKAAAPDAVTPPDAVVAALKDDAAAITEYVGSFSVETRQNAAGQWVNVAVLTEAAEAALQRQVDVGEAMVLDNLVGGKLSLTDVTPGFRYAVEFGESLMDMSVLEAVMATGKGVELELPNGAASGFYRIVVHESATK